MIQNFIWNRDWKVFKLAQSPKHFEMCLCNSQFVPGLQKPLWPPLDCSVLQNIPFPNYPSSSPQIHLCYSVSVSSEETLPDPSAETLQLHAQKRHAEKSQTSGSVSRAQIMSFDKYGRFGKGILFYFERLFMLGLNSYWSQRRTFFQFHHDRNNMMIDFWFSLCFLTIQTVKSLLVLNSFSL